MALLLLRADVPDPEGLLQSWSLGEALPRPELNATAGIGENRNQSGALWPAATTQVLQMWPYSESGHQAGPPVWAVSCRKGSGGKGALVLPTHNLRIWQRRISAPGDFWLSGPAPVPCAQ